MRDQWKLKLVALLLACMLAVMALAGCGGADNSKDGSTDASDTPSSSVVQDPQGDDDDDTPDGGTPTPASVTSFESNDGFVTDLFPVQVMGKGLDSSSGELYDMVNYVAGKETAVVATLAEDVVVDTDGSMLLTVYRDGEEVTQLLPVNGGTMGSTVFFAPRSLGDVNNWQAGSYSFEFSFNDSTAVRTNVFGTAKKIKVLAVPMVNNYAGNIVACEGEWQTAIQFTKDTYPLAYDGVEYVLGNELDLSDDKFDLTTDEGCYYVWEALSNLQTPNNDYELILGFARERQGADGNTQGYTYGKPANIITESDGDMQPTVAHEIAHCYNVGDEYPGGSMNPAVNEPPYGMEGSDWNNRDETIAGQKQAVESASDYGNDNTGSIIFPQQYPMNTSTLQQLENIGSFMGSGSDDINDYWITSDIWNQLYKAYTGGNIDAPAASASGDDDTAGDDMGDTGDEDDADTDDAAEDDDDYDGGEDADAAANLGYACPACDEAIDPAASNYYLLCDECGSLIACDISTDTEIDCDECGATTELQNSNTYVQCASCEELTALADLATAQASPMSMKLAAPAYTGQAAPAADVKAIDITGKMFKAGSFEPTPWYTYEADPADLDAQQSGSYAVVMEDAAGAVLSTQYFDVLFQTQSNPPRDVDYMPVNVTAQYHENTATVKVMQGDTELYSMPVTASAPVVDFTGIQEDQLYTGKQAVSWEASDADGDELWYELWYCPSEDEFINVASNIRETSYTVDFDTLPGSTEGYFYLYATDGVNTGEIASPWIQVAYKAPEIISSQAQIPEYKLTDEIMLDADIYDKQDGWLWDYDQATWTLNGREYMTGSLLWVYPYELSPGEHTFTLTATNSQGVQASRDFTFRVLDDESALPDDWSREDIKAALANGFVAPLQNVNAAITRGQFAQLMANLYWTVWEEGSPEPDYVEGVVTDCGQDDYDQFLMVQLGVMEAPGGKFSPNSNLTEEEAALIMVRICAMGDPTLVDDTTDAAEAAEICANSGVMNEDGDNAYSADSKITGRLALVRCNRLYDAIFGE